MCLLICGVDEAGRGPLAGSVYAAAVILDVNNPILGLMDSKKLSEKKRDFLARKSNKKPSLGQSPVAPPKKSTTLTFYKPAYSP